MLCVYVLVQGIVRTEKVNAGEGGQLEKKYRIKDDSFLQGRADGGVGRNLILTP